MVRETKQTVAMHDHAVLNYLNVLVGRFEYKFIPTRSARTKVVTVNKFIKMQVPLLKKQNDDKSTVLKKESASVLHNIL